MEQNPYQPPVAAGLASDGGLSTGSYEFTEAENLTIAKMGSRAWWWGLLSVIAGVVGLLALGGMFAIQDQIVAAGLEPRFITIIAVTLAPLVVTHLVIAFNYMGAGSSLKAVVTTEGNDVEHLMQSLHKLGTAFMVEFFVGVVAFAIGFSAGLYFYDDIRRSSSSSFDFDFDD